MKALFAQFVYIILLALQYYLLLFINSTTN